MGFALKSRRRTIMEKRSLSIPQLMFIAGTRAALGAGVALLASARLSGRKRRAAGAALALVGAVTTIPAARMLSAARPSILEQVAHKLS
jgi:hypothetical protein